MKNLLIAAAILAATGGNALAAACQFPNGDLPDGPYTTTLANNGNLVDVTKPFIDGGGTGLGGSVVGGLLSICLTNPANTLAHSIISVFDAFAITDSGGNALTSFTFLLDGVAYAADDLGGGAAGLDVLLAAGPHTLGITNHIQQLAGTGSYAGVPVPASYASDEIIVSMQVIENVPLPEPASMALLGFGLAGIATLRRRRGA